MQKKTAQALKRRHKARRYVNPTGKALTMLSPAFKKTISNLDKVDKKVRKEAEDLNYYIGMAKSFRNRRDYLTAATYLAKFHGKVKTIHHELNTFNKNISEPQRKFLLNNFKAKDKRDLFGYDPNKKIEDKKNAIEEASEFFAADDGFVSTAGALKDWWRVPGRFSDLKSKLTDSKSKAMRAMERNFSIEFFAQLKTDTVKMLDETENFFKELLVHFHNMGSSWAQRNVGQYVKSIVEINARYDSYHPIFLEYYKRNIVPMKEEQAKLDAASAKLVEERNAKELEKRKDNTTVTDESLKPYVVADPFPSNNSDVDSSAATVANPNGPISETRVTTKNDFSDNGPMTQRSPTVVPVNQVTQGPTSAAPSTLNAPSKDWRAPAKDSPNFQRLRNKVDTQRFPNFVPNDVKPQSEPFSFNPMPGYVAQNTDKEMDGAEFDLVKRKTVGHNEFLSRIEKLSTDEEIILEILAYSEEVEKYSEEESLKLLSVAEGLVLKHGAAKKKTITKEPEPVAAPKSEPYPDDDPDTEMLSPDTQRSTPAANVGPNTRRVEENALPLPKPQGDLVNQLHHDKFQPVEHHIPEGFVKKRWFQIPFLARKHADDIRVSSMAADVIVKAIVVMMRAKHLPYSQIENFQQKFVKAIKYSIVQGEVESNMKCSNNNDCSLQVFSGFSLEKLDSSPSFAGLAISFTASCRLSELEGHISVGKITNVQLHNVAE